MPSCLVVATHRGVNAMPWILELNNALNYLLLLFRIGFVNLLIKRFIIDDFRLVYIEIELYMHEMKR